MDVPFPVGVDARGGYAGGGDLLLPLSEHCCIIYPDKAHYGPVSGGGAASSISGIKAVVGKLGARSIGDRVCRSDGRVGNRLVGRGW